MIWGCLGRECKLGWGYNKFLHRTVPISGEFPTTGSFRNWKEYWWYNLSPADIVHSEWISHSLEPTYRKLLDFQNITDGNQYWQFHYCFIQQRFRTNEHLNYLSGCTHFVSCVDNGVDLWVQFPKMGFPESQEKVRWISFTNLVSSKYEYFQVEELFKNRNFDRDQKKVRCRILLNYREVKELTLEELTQFMIELEKGKPSENIALVEFLYRKLDNKIRQIVINNEVEFIKFLTYLYCVYRKIEMKMEDVKYSDILPDLDSDEKSFTSICMNLDKAKEDYRSMDRINFLSMYPVLKKLFFSYIDYIRYSVERFHDIDDGDHLPGTIDELKSWLLQLDTRFLININGECSL